MIRFRILYVFFVVLAITLPLTGRAAGSDQPNLVFIMVDDLGKDWIGCYGADNIETPHIDALAAGGKKFNKCYSMPQCTPTRATLLTGPYPWRNGFTNHWDVPRWGVGYFDWEKYTDALVGRLTHAFDELGIRERTILIFTTENGYGEGVRGTINGRKPSGGKASNFEGRVCEPLIVNCPGLVPAGVESDALTDFSDWLPTFAELGGAAVPPSLTIDGHAIAPVILGKLKHSSREWIMAIGHGAGTLDEEGVRSRDDYSDRVIRDQRYKIWIDTNRQTIKKPATKKPATKKPGKR